MLNLSIGFFENNKIITLDLQIGNKFCPPFHFGQNNTIKGEIYTLIETKHFLRQHTKIT